MHIMNISGNRQERTDYRSQFIHYPDQFISNIGYMPHVHPEESRGKGLYIGICTPDQ